jgi:flagellar motility protein MotE (MotC chaperone)
MAWFYFNVSALRKKLEGGIDNKLKEIKKQTKHKNKKIEKLEGGVENQRKRKRSWGILSLWHVFILIFMF